MASFLAAHVTVVRLGAGELFAASASQVRQFAPSLGRLPRSTFRFRASSDGDSGTSTSAATSEAPAGAPKKSVIRRVKKAEPSPPEADLELKALDDPRVSYEGVVRLDKGSSLSLGQLALLAGGDILTLVVFAYIGRATHVSAAVDFELLKTAFPFLTGWLVSALLFGDYSPSRSRPAGFAAVASDTAKTWAVGVPVGIAIRSVLKGQPPQVPFIIVSFITTAILVTAWRTAYFSLVAKDEGAAGGDASEKKGNVFEFFELLTSLVRRW